MSKVRTVTVLGVCYFFAEIAHWLPVSSSKALANSMHFGNASESCLAEFEAACEPNRTDCEMDCYTGTGLDVQNIFGFYFVLPISVTSIIFGYLADFPYRLKLFAGAMALLSAAQAGIALSTAYIWLVVARVVIGSCAGAFQPIAGAIISSTFGAAAARGMSFFNWGIYLGFATSFLLAQIFENSRWGWRTSYILTGIMGMILAPVCLFCVKDEWDDSTRRNKEKVESGSNLLQEDDSKPSGPSYWSNLTGYFRQLARPEVLLMIVGGMFRHTAGFTWGYNQALYMQAKSPDNPNIRYYLMICPVIAGVSGATLGGFLTDYLRKSPKFPGAKGGLAVLSASHYVGAPFIFFALYLPDPICFVCLYVGYFVIEMWFGVYLMSLADLFDKSVRGQAIGYTIFILRLVAGILPGVIVPFLKVHFSYFAVLALLVPGFHLVSATLFLATFFVVKGPNSEEGDTIG